jgi:ERCC4-type nuclease
MTTAFIISKGIRYCNVHYSSIAFVDSIQIIFNNSRKDTARMFEKIRRRVSFNLTRTNEHYSGLKKIYMLASCALTVMGNSATARQFYH